MSESVRAAPPSHGLLAATTLLKRLFNTFEGHLAMQLWNGDPLRLGRAPPSNGSPPYTLVIRNPGAISAMGSDSTDCVSPKRISGETSTSKVTSSPRWA